MKTYLIKVPTGCVRVYEVQAENETQAQLLILSRRVDSYTVEGARFANMNAWTVREIVGKVNG